jgi:archaellum component FlaC
LNYWIDEAHRENEWSDLMDVRYRIEALTAENKRLRVQLADLANTINIVGSHYHKAQVALDDLVLDVKKRARAALEGKQ